MDGVLDRAPVKVELAQRLELRGRERRPPGLVELPLLDIALLRPRQAVVLDGHVDARVEGLVEVLLEVGCQDHDARLVFQEAEEDLNLAGYQERAQH